MATITFDQVGLSSGVTDRARTDGLSTGALVTITVSPGGGTLEFVDVPPGDSTAVSSLTGGPTVWTFSPTASVYGTWLVQYVVGGVTVRRLFSVKTPKRSFRIPAFNEKASVVATLANGSSHVADSDDNESGTYKGWWSALNDMFQALERGNPDPQVSTSGPTYSASVNTLVFVNVSGGAVTVNLPSGHVQGDSIKIKLSSVATNPCTIDPNGSETIDGASALVLSDNYEWANLVSNGINWLQVG